MGRKAKFGSDTLPEGKVMPLLDLIKACNDQGLRLWVQTSCPPVHLPVDMTFLQKRTQESYDFRKYHAIWVQVTTNHSVGNGILHCKYVEYKAAEKPPYEAGHRAEEKQRAKKSHITDILIKIAKQHSHAKNQNLHRKSLRKIRKRRAIR